MELARVVSDHFPGDLDHPEGRGLEESFTDQGRAAATQRLLSSTSRTHLDGQPSALP